MARQASKGDELAFEALVAAYHRDVLRVCQLMCRRQQDADDAAQATWSRVWQTINTLRDPDRVRAWIMAIAANESRQLLRREWRRSRLLLRRPNPERALDPDLIDLRNVFDRLPADERHLLALRHAAGMTSVEIAEVLGASDAVVRVRLSRLHQKMRKDLDRD